ncbi:MAG TPA: hypothetical protein VLX28_10080, partial [Thermoanaerobaculia bacterium]|nr:hypothetical protein [Thermoanaerobaculia bacterium]
MTVEEAAPEDDPELRRLLRDNPMAGEIRVSLEREPNAFLAAAVEGEPHRTIVARDPEGGIVGMGSRSVWNAFVNGEPCRLGYLSQLRVDRAHRGRKRLLRLLSRPGRSRRDARRASPRPEGGGGSPPS